MTMLDVAVVGAGPAGIAAAAVAAEAGLAVALVDGAPNLGGNIWRHANRAALPATAQRWMARLDASGASVHMGSTVVDAQPTGAGFALQVASEGSHQEAASPIEARNIIMATGARELFLPFPGWTLPGVVGVGGGQALLKSGGSFTGKRIVIAGSGPLLLPVAAAFAQAGAIVTHVLEQAPFEDVASFALELWRTPERVLQAAVYRAAIARSRYSFGTWVKEAHGASHITGVTITNGSETVRVPCDYLCVGYGLVPALELARLMECEIRDGSVVTDDMQCTSRQGIFCVGEGTGIKGVDAAVLEGTIAAHACAGHAGDVAHLQRSRARERAFGERMAATFRVRSEVLALARPDTIVCRCEDVTLGDIDGCASMREAKLHTRAGMGPCQARVCGPALALMRGWQESTVRPPLMPVAVSALLEHTEPRHTSARAEETR